MVLDALCGDDAALFRNQDCTHLAFCSDSFAVLTLLHCIIMKMITCIIIP